MFELSACCLVVDVDDFLPRATQAAPGWAERTRDTLQHLIDDVVHMTGMADGANLQHSFPDEWVLVLRSPDPAELARRAEHAAAAVLRGVRAGGEVTVTVAVGRVTTGPNAVPDAISSARRAHRAKLALGPDRLIAARPADGDRDVPAPHDVHRVLARAIVRGESDRACRLLLDWFRVAADRAGGDDVLVRRWLLGQVLSTTAVLNGRLGVGTASDWMAVCAAAPYQALAELADLHEPAAVAAWVERVVDALATGCLRAPVRTSTLSLVRRHVDQHFTDHRLRLKNVATAVGVSSFHISHLFRAELDTTFSDYVTQRRVRYARRLLERTHLGMAQVARASGFANPVQLRRVLVRETGVTPSATRQSARDRASARFELLDQESEALTGASAPG